MKKVSAEDHGLSDAELTTIKAILADYWQKIDKACLFGSRACGQYKTYSDIDLVLYGNLQEREVDRIYTLFDDSSLGLRVDVQAYQHIQYPPLKRHIDTMAKVLFTRQEIKEERETGSLGATTLDRNRKPI